MDVAEGALIDFFGARGFAEWNASGFGSKVAGHRRGQQEASDWSRSFPPNLDAVLSLGVTSPTALAKLLKALASDAPLRRSPYTVDSHASPCRLSHGAFERDSV